MKCEYVANILWLAKLKRFSFEQKILERKINLKIIMGAKFVECERFHEEGIKKLNIRWKKKETKLEKVGSRSEKIP